MESACSRRARAVSMRPAWLSRAPRPISARHSQRRSPISRARPSDDSNCTLASSSLPPAISTRPATRSTRASSGGSQPGGGAHDGHEFVADAERPARPQAGPGALQRIGGHLGVAARGGPATGRDEVVELDAFARDGRLLIEAGEVGAMSNLCCAQRVRTAAGIAASGAQVLRGVLLHADQEIEAIVGDLPDERLVHQRLQRVHRPRRVLVPGQVQDRLHRLEREPALEHRQLRQRGLLGQTTAGPRTSRTPPAASPAGPRGRPPTTAA